MGVRAGHVRFLFAVGFRFVSFLAAVCLLVLPGRFGTAAAQDLRPVVIQCATGGSFELFTACQSAVLAAQAMRGGIALADAMGASLSGSYSTLGRRLGSAPRVSADIRLRMVRFNMPDILAGGTGVAGGQTLKLLDRIPDVPPRFAQGVLDAAGFLQPGAQLAVALERA